MTEGQLERARARQVQNTANAGIKRKKGNGQRELWRERSRSAAAVPTTINPKKPAGLWAKVEAHKREIQIIAMKARAAIRGK